MQVVLSLRGHMTRTLGKKKVSLRGSYLPDSDSLEEPANTFRPSLKVIDRAFALSEPSFARYPTTVIRSPGFKVLLNQPRRIRAFGLPNSRSHDVTLPPCPVTSRRRCA